MEPKLFDIHSHLNLSEFDQDWSEVLDRTLVGGCWTITVGADLASSKKAVEIANSKKTGVWATVGFHPTDATDFTKENWEQVKNLAKDPKVVAIGECGLEYFQRMSNVKGQMSNGISETQKGIQKDLFRKHIELALELDKPLMIHCRPALSLSNGPSEGSQDAYEDVIDILREYKQEAGDRLRGNFHFFAGNWETAKKSLDLGFTLSFTGVITFAGQYDEVVKNTPSDMIMSETDAPFVAPAPHRGKRCEPLYVAEVAKKIAELKDVSVQQMAEILVNNGRRLFRV